MSDTPAKPGAKPAPRPAAKPAPAPKAPPAEETPVESTGEAKEEKECKITKSQFRTAPLAVQTGQLVLNRKEFSSGTLGYFAQVTITVLIDGVPVKMNGNCQVFVPHSAKAKD